MGKHYVKLASVFVCIAVRVTNEGAFPVVRKLAPTHGDIVTGVCNIKKTIIVILTATVKK